MSLWQYIIRRLLFMIFVLIGVSLIVFSVMMFLPPGMRVAAYVSSEKIRPDQFDNIIRTYGLNDPAPVQYFRWLKKILILDFGYSSTADAPVIEGFKRFFPVTLELVLFAIPFIILTGIWLGTKAAINQNKPLDHGIRIFAIVGYSLPLFWLGLLLLLLFYGLMGIFPPGMISDKFNEIYYSDTFKRYTGMFTIDGILNGKWQITLDALYHMLLPAITLVIIDSALIMRLMRSNMLSSLGQDYVLTAIAKGADRRTVNLVHARRNALIPVITISGIMFAGLLSGMVLTETIFNRKGIGWWMARAALQLDVPTIMFNVLFLGVLFVFANLVVDIVNAALDPRIRLS